MARIAKNQRCEEVHLVVGELGLGLLVPDGPGHQLPLLPGRHLGLLLGRLALAHRLGEASAVPGEVEAMEAMLVAWPDLACLATSSTSMACERFTILWNHTLASRI